MRLMLCDDGFQFALVIIRVHLVVHVLNTDFRGPRVLWNITRHSNIICVNDTAPFQKFGLLLSVFS